MAELIDDETERDGDDVGDPYRQHGAETQGRKLRSPSRKNGGGKLPHAPAEMSEADPPTEI